jgi:hypothetical protein
MLAPARPLPGHGALRLACRLRSLRTWSETAHDLALSHRRDRLRGRGDARAARLGGLLEAPPDRAHGARLRGRFLLLAQALERGLPIGPAYAIWAGLGVALVAVFGKLLFDDPLTAVTAIRMVLIIGGVALVELSTAR